MKWIGKVFAGVKCPRCGTIDDGSFTVWKKDSEARHPSGQSGPEFARLLGSICSNCGEEIPDENPS